MGHFLLLAVLWITRDLGGVGGWGSLFPPKYVLLKVESRVEFEKHFKHIIASLPTAGEVYSS